MFISAVQLGTLRFKCMGSDSRSIKWPLGDLRFLLLPGDVGCAANAEQILVVTDSLMEETYIKKQKKDSRHTKDWLCYTEGAAGAAGGAAGAGLLSGSVVLCWIFYAGSWRRRRGHRISLRSSFFPRKQQFLPDGTI